jgi:hypothetical protein
MASMFLLAFFPGEALELPFSASQFGLPSAVSLRRFDLRAHARATATEWFDGWRTGALRRIALGDLGGLEALDATTMCHTFTCQVQAPVDLSHVQAGWAIARWMVARGATVVVDALSNRYWSAAEVAAVPADAPFDLDRELRVVFETAATVGAGHVAHTRGMSRFGRPDLVAVVREDDAAWAGELLRSVAGAFAEGALPGADVVIELPDGTGVVLAEDGLGFAAKLGLSNDARVLVTEAGGALADRPNPASER